MHTFYKKIRRQHSSRLTPLFIQLLYRKSFKIYISDVGGMYRPVYARELDFDTFSFQGQFAFVDLGHDDYALCMLHSTDSPDLYKLTEVPIAFSRMPVRKLTTNVSSIMCILSSC